MSDLTTTSGVEYLGTSEAVPVSGLLAFTLCNEATGKPGPRGCSLQVDIEQMVRPGQVVYYGHLSDTQYVLGGLVQEMPARPSAAHFWDWPTHTYVEDLQPARDAASERIEAERSRRVTEPLEYEGVLVDADATAQANVSAKLLELQQAAALGMETPVFLLVWRDAGNVTHTFETSTAYAAWLGGLAVQLARRGTEAYQWAWAQKAALAEASTLQAITAFPIELTSSTDTTESTNP